ncbi:MAG: hypothetical protein HYZ40_15000, partial [Rhodospirillales bacterium]|nr:hypothetical protein [Rhodospirillales bacterium]
MDERRLFANWRRDIPICGLASKRADWRCLVIVRVNCRTEREARAGGVVRVRRAVSAAILLAAVLFSGSLQARTAKIALSVTGDEAMGADLRELVETFEKQQPLTGDGLSLLQAAQAALSRVNAALRSRGFYDAEVRASVEGRPIAEAAALDAIEAQPDSAQVSIAMTVETGPRYRIGTVAIRPPGAMASLPDVDRSRIGLVPGDPADAAAIVAAQDKVLVELRKQGHALATAKREVVVDHATRQAEVTYIVEPGPTAKMGKVRFSGTEKVDTTYLQRRWMFLPDPQSARSLRFDAENAVSSLQATRLS